MKKIVLVLFGGAMLCLLAFYILTLRAPVGFPAGIVLTVERGQTLDDLATELKRANVVRSASAFRYMALLLSGKLRGRPIVGSYPLEGQAGAFSIAWRVMHGSRRLGTRNPGEGTPTQNLNAVHTFEPQEWHRVFVDGIPPVLRIRPGETVKTWTLDSGGRDSHQKRRSLRGNPQIGPFYIEGASPGDTLAVTLSSVRINRGTARSGNRLFSGMLDHEYELSLNEGSPTNGNWLLDAAGGFARPARAAGTAPFSVPLHPMLGCVGVAPGGHLPVSTISAGAFGGNLDYSRIGPGATVLLPVSVEGGLLFLGDGHAAQGDGELTGDALETSLDVEFKVGLERGSATAFPRVENGERLMALGVARTLAEALQISREQLALWLRRDFGATPTEISVLFGSGVRYEVAKLVAPQTVVSASISKDSVAALRGTHTASAHF